VSENPGRTLSATALVHEAYLQLAGAEMDWQDRVNFFAVAAHQMRRILVDHARTRHRLKRGGGGRRVDLDQVTLAAPEVLGDVVAVDEALNRLAVFDPRKSRIVELVYFGGMTTEETSVALAVSAATVNRELKMAKAWLHASWDRPELRKSRAPTR
jgi:RNA polymerase sigma-70 factor (ECF subfamily)